MSVSDYECLIPAQPRGQPTVGGPPSSTLQLTKYTKTIKAQTKATTITNLPAQRRGQLTVGGPPYLTDQRSQPNMQRKRGQRTRERQ